MRLFSSFNCCFKVKQNSIISMSLTPNFQAGFDFFGEYKISTGPSERRSVGLVYWRICQSCRANSIFINIGNRIEHRGSLKAPGIVAQSRLYQAAYCVFYFSFTSGLFLSESGRMFTLQTFGRVNLGRTNIQ